ncbi:N-acetylmuramoyl-L-alanine amidase, partial [Paramagnetospirillum caucaseum]
MRTRPRFLSALMALALAWGVGGVPRSLAATASGARLGIHSEGVTRFVLDLSDQVVFKVTPMADPYRIAIDLAGTDFAGPAGISKPWGSVNSLHLEGERIVLDLRKPALVKSAFIIPPRDGMGHRLVVDLSETTREAFLAAAGTGGKAPVLKPPAAAKPAEEFRLPEAVPAEAARPPVNPPGGNPLTANRIVVTSPNAPAETALPPPEPVTAAPVVVASSPVNLIAPPMPVERPSPAEKAGRAPQGAPMLSAPMPPPPERPAAAPPPAAQPAPPPPQQQVLQPPPSAPETVAKAKAKDGV